MMRFTAAVLHLASFLALSSPAEGEGVRLLTPAEDSPVGWVNASIPLGNGWFGANVFGIVEMLVQSREGEVKLLPALPREWASAGQIKGLRIRGGWEVDLEWREAKVVDTKLRPVSPGATVRPRFL